MCHPEFDTLKLLNLPHKPFCYGLIQSYLMTTYSYSPSGEFSAEIRLTVESKSTPLIYQMLPAL